MKRIIGIVLAGLALGMVFPVAAFAFSWNPVDWIKSGLEAGGLKLLAWILTAVLGLAICGGVMFARVIRTLKEAGELQIAIAEAVADRKFDPEELKRIAHEARDVYDIWKPTPEQYAPKDG